MAPYGNGRGPAGGSRGTGKGRGAGRSGGSAGMGRQGAGLGGECVCPSCGERVPHERGVPCYSVLCPACGSKMVRE